MATDVERLVVSLEASITKYERAMARALGQTNRTAKNIETRFNRMSGVISTQFARVGATLASGAGIAAAQRLIDANTRITNALKIAGLQGEALTATYNDLASVAQRSGASFESLAVLYGRVSQSAKELGADSEAVMRFTEGVSNALRIAGTTTSQASGALLQLSQALGSARIQAEEFNSINEGARPILQTVADNILEAGGSVSKLKALVNDGKVSNKAFFDAFLQGSDALTAKAQNARVTIQGEFENLTTEAIKVAGEIDKAFGVSESAASGIRSIAAAIREIPGALEEAMPWLNKFAEFVQFMSNLSLDANKFGRSIGDQLGTSGIGPALNNAMAPSGKAFREGIFGGSPQSVDEIAAALGMGPDWRAPYQGKGPGRSPTGPGKKAPISLANYPVSGSGAAGKESPFARETRQIKEQTAALVAQQTALASVNPLFEDYGFALEKAKAEQELLAAAQREGLTITPELRASIEQLAIGYATASANAEQLAEKQERLREFRDLAKDTLGGFISDIRSGTSAIDALGNALDRIADKLLSMALDAAFQNIFSGFGGGSTVPVPRPNPFVMHTGGIVGATSARRAVSPGVFAGAERFHDGNYGLKAGEVPAILRRGELVIPKVSAGGSMKAQNTNVRVELYNESGERLQQQERGRRMDPEGPVIEIVLNAIAEGRADQVMTGRFGVRPTTIGR